MSTQKSKNFRISVPQKPMETINSPNIDKLFSVIQGGNIDDIEVFISQTATIYNLRDKDNATPLHIILNENNKLDESHKLRLIKLLVSEIPINSLDNQGRSPLHLATKYQYNDIVEYLLNKGADVNQRDSQGMTPLHYITLGLNVECPDKEKNKPKAIIPDPQSDKRMYNDKLKQIIDDIIAKMDDDDIQYFIKHITETLMSYDEYFENDLENIKTSILDNIVESIKKKSSTTELIKGTINTEILAIRSNLEEKIKYKIGIVTKKLNIKSGYDNGWAPIGDTNKLNKVIDFDIKAKIDNLKNNIAKQNADIVHRHDEIVDKITEHIESYLQNYLGIIWDFLGSDGQINVGVARNFNIEYTHSNHGNIEPLTAIDYRKYIRDNNYRQDIEYHDIEYYYDNASNAQDDIPFFANYNASQLGNISTLLQLIGIDTRDTGIMAGATHPTYCWPTRLKHFILNNLNSDKNINLLRNIYLNLNPRAGGNAGHPDYGMRDNLNTIFSTNLDNNDIICLVYNICNTTVNVPSGGTRVMTINNILDEVGTAQYDPDVHTYALYKKIHYILKLLYVIEIYKNRLQVINNFNYHSLTNYYDFLNGFTNNIYRFCSNMINDVIIKTIDQINNINAIRYMEEFYSINNIAPTNVDHIYNHELLNILQLPESYNRNIVETISNNMNLKNSGQIIYHSSPIALARNRVYIAGNIIKNKKNIILAVDPLQINNKIIFKLNKLSPPPPPQMIIGPSEGILNAQLAINKDSKIGIINNNAFRHGHLQMAKVQAIQNLLQKYHDESVAANPNYTKLIDELSIDNTIIDNKHTILLVTAGNVFDEMLNNLFEDVIKQFSIKYIRKVLNNAVEYGSNENYTNIINNILNNGTLNNIYPLAEENSSKLNLGDIIKNYVKQYFNNNDPDMINIDKLSIARSLVEEKPLNLLSYNDNEQTIHYVYNIEYNTSTNVKTCYRINTQLLQLLFKNNKILCNANIKDIKGNTPIFYALKYLNSKYLKILLKNGARLYKIENELRQDPLNYFIDRYDIHNKFMYNERSVQMLKNLTTTLNDKMVNKLMQSPNNGNVPKYFNQILKVFIIMYNHHLFDDMLNYMRLWNKDDNVKFNEILNKYLKINIKMPNNLTTLYKLTDDDINKISAVSNKLAPLTTFYNNEMSGKAFTDKHNKIYEIEKRIENYKKELINAHGNDLTTIDNKINNLTIELNNLRSNDKEINVASYNSHMQNNSNQITTKLRQMKINIQERLSENVIDHYENNMFQNILSGEEHSYMEWWKCYVENIYCLDSYENVHLNLCRLTNSFIQKSKKILNKPHKSDIKMLSDDMKIISDLYKKIIIPLNNDYHQLPPKLNKNYSLKRIYDIYVHIIKHFVTTNFYGSIVKLIYNYVKTKNIKPMTFIQNNEVTYNMVDSIIQYKYNGTNLQEYLFDKYTSRMVSSLMKVYNDTDDYDPEELIDDNVLNNNIKNILLNNNIIIIDNDSELIKALDTNIFPFYKEVFSLAIENLRSITNIYQRYLYNEDINLQILITLFDEIQKHVK
jgi:ankyrin repeat protein